MKAFLSILFTIYFFYSKIRVKKFYLPLTIKNACSYCRVRSPDLKKCGRCKCLYYCSRECQKKDWSKHKTNCYTEETGVDVKVRELEEIIANATKNGMMEQLREMYLESSNLSVQLSIIPTQRSQYKYFCKVLFMENIETDSQYIPENPTPSNSSISNSSISNPSPSISSPSISSPSDTFSRGWLTAYLDAPKDQQKNGYKEGCVHIITHTDSEKKSKASKMKKFSLTFLLNDRGEKWFGVPPDREEEIEKTVL